MKQCTSCGAKIKDESNFCSSCGNDTFIVKGAVKGKNNKWIIGVAVCVVLGIIGAIALDDSPLPSTTTTEAKIISDYSVDEITSVSATTEYTSSKATNTTIKTTYSSTQPSTSAPTTSFVSREIPITSDFQYQLNSFLSRYSETNLQSFEGYPTPEALAEFGVRYTYIHQKDNWEKLENPVKIGGNTYNYRIEDKYVSRAITDHFRVAALIPDFHENKADHYNDYYYHYEMGGMDTDDLTVVTRVVQVSEHDFEVYFKLYDAASNNRNMYSMNDAQVQAEMTQKPFIRYVGNGKAVIESYDINDISSSRLSAYYIY